LIPYVHHREFRPQVKGFISTAPEVWSRPWLVSDVEAIG